MKLYVGNLPWSIDQSGLKNLFSEFTPEEAVLITDKYSGRSKGFGFVTIADDEAAKKAISEMHEKEIEGRPLTVSEARPMVPRDNAPRASPEESGSNEAPMADPSAIENAGEESPEVVNENTAPKGEEEAPETADEAVEDAE
jgi:RNA recognition motif-containing protein